MADLVERALKHLGRPETRQLMNELADHIAALEAEASKGERRGLERAAKVAEEQAYVWGERLSKSGVSAEFKRSCVSSGMACEDVIEAIRALIPEAPVREAE